MKGHKRPEGRPVCPITTTASTESWLLSPLCLSSRSATENANHSPTDTSVPDPRPTTPRTLPSNLIDPPFVIPETGPWHRRNPHWEGSTPPPEQPLPRASSPVPTVLVDDDGNTIRGSDDGHNPDVVIGNDDSGDVDQLHASPREMMEPVLCIYSVQPRDIGRFCNEATKMEVYTNMMRSPVRSQRRAAAQDSGAHGSPTEDPWWLVTSRDAELVKLVVDSQEHRAMQDLLIKSSAVKWVTRFQLILTGVVGGCVALCMESLFH